MKLIRHCLTVALLSLSFFTFGGGSHFPVKITDINTDGLAFEFKATVEGIFNYEPTSDCNSISVTGIYDSEKWRGHPRLINAEIHAEALQQLQQAAKSESKVNLGYIGEGFYKIGKCEFKSKGLLHENGTVFSIYTSV